MCFVWLSEQTVVFALYIINRLVFVTEMESVHSAVRTESLYKADTSRWFLLQKWRLFTARYGLSPYITRTRLVGFCNRNGECSQRSTD